MMTKPYRRALVSGASSGLGAHLAGRLVQDGWQVVGVGRRAKDESLAPPEVDYIQADLADVDVLEPLREQIGETPDLIVHNAVTYPDPAASEIGLDRLEEVFRVNALVPYQLTLDLLVARDTDRFCSCVMINSESIYHADEKSGVYAASKAALRVLTTALANRCRSVNASVATLLLGPLADARKVDELRRVAEKRGVSEAEITRLLLRRSNPDLVITELIDFESCYRSIAYIESLGAVANGMLCRLDGGSAGSLL